MASVLELPVVNLHEATFECTYGRGCAGVCCQNGRPGLHPDERDTIAANLDRFLPHLRPEARKVLARHGFLTRRVRNGLPLVPVVRGWCLFFNEGCVLHKVGAAEGDKYRYKPGCCSLFPLVPDDAGRWWVRQTNDPWEEWNLFCLDPRNSPVPAAESLQEEVALIARIEARRRDHARNREAENGGRIPG